MATNTVQITEKRYRMEPEEHETTLAKLNLQ